MKKKILYLSDLHLEFTDYQPKVVPSQGEDFVVLAGDIGVGLKGIRWAQEVFRDREVVYVLGNHEFYGHEWVEVVDRAKTRADGSNVTFLECGETEIAGLRILGCTLWSDFKLFGADRQNEMMVLARDCMNDYEEIYMPRGQRLSPSDTVRRCEQSVAWLKKALAASDQPTLVVTHHAPSLATQNPRHIGDDTNAAYHSHFDELLVPPCVGWIHGHTHHSIQTEVNGIPLVSNQRGYPREEPGTFSWGRLLELDVPS